MGCIEMQTAAGEGGAFSKKLQQMNITIPNVNIEGIGGHEPPVTAGCHANKNTKYIPCCRIRPFLLLPAFALEASTHEHRGGWGRPATPLLMFVRHNSRAHFAGC